MAAIHEKHTTIIFAIAFLLLAITFRLWQLTAWQKDERSAAVKRRFVRTIFEPPKRATIRDRFGIVLATNRLEYGVAIRYSEIKQIPSVRYLLEGGVRVKCFPRREAIERLARFLAKELNEPLERIEELITSKAPLYDPLPFKIKSNLDEQLYYRIRTREHQFPGLVAIKEGRRFYPQGSSGCDLVGYLGAINQAEFATILERRKALNDLLQRAELEGEVALDGRFGSIEELQEAISLIDEETYRKSDLIGKAGVEKEYDHLLRGRFGLSYYYCDSRGNLLHKLPTSKHAVEGKPLKLTISSELQMIAEQLLIESDEKRRPRIFKERDQESSSLDYNGPWMKGGAIVAIDPRNGEIVAMASYPRFQPNDFIPGARSDRNKAIHRWLESESAIAAIWEGRDSFSKEIWDQKSEKITLLHKKLTWRGFLSSILPENPRLCETISQIKVGAILAFHRALEPLESLSLEEKKVAIHALFLPKSCQLIELPAAIKERVAIFLNDNQSLLVPLQEWVKRYYPNYQRWSEIALLIDLSKLLVDHTIHDPMVSSPLEELPLHQLYELMQLKALCMEKLQPIAENIFYHHSFLPWKLDQGATFLKEKRKEERFHHRPTQAASDYFDKKGRESFLLFWNEKKNQLLRMVFQRNPSSPLEEELLSQWERERFVELQTGSISRLFEEILAPLSPQEGELLIKRLRSYEELKRPLWARYRTIKGEYPTEDELARSFYPRYGFGFGRSHAFRQWLPQGSIFKLLVAYAALCERVFHNQELNPMNFFESKRVIDKMTYLGYLDGGQAIPKWYKGGVLPSSMTANLGQLDLKKALEFSSNPYFSLLAAEVIGEPERLLKAASSFGLGAPTEVDLPGEVGGTLPSDLSYNRSGYYSFAIGQHTLLVTPLQTSLMIAAIANGGLLLTPRVARSESVVQPRCQLFMPKEIQEYLLDAMRSTQERIAKSGSRYTHLYDRKTLDALIALKGSMGGKSSTAEVQEVISIDPETPPLTINHVGYGAILFEEEEADLVIIVYLRYGGVGKEAAPIAAKIAESWRRLKKLSSKPM